MEITTESVLNFSKNENMNSSEEKLSNGNVAKEVAAHEMTSKDYYFDSYAHFGNSLFFVLKFSIY
jgi:hypothetical protein